MESESKEIIVKSTKIDTSIQKKKFIIPKLKKKERVKISVIRKNN